MRMLRLSLFLVASGLLLTGCCEWLFFSDDRCWRFECGEACSPCVDSARAILHPCPPCRQLSVQIVRDSCGCYTTISTECCYFCDPCVCSLTVPVEITCGENEPVAYDGYSLRGGQRVVLSDEAQEALIQALWDNECPVVKIGTLKAPLNSAKFRESFLKVMRR